MRPFAKVIRTKGELWVSDAERAQARLRWLEDVEDESS